MNWTHTLDDFQEPGEAPNIHTYIHTYIHVWSPNMHTYIHVWRLARRPEVPPSQSEKKGIERQILNAFDKEFDTLRNKQIL